MLIGKIEIDDSPVQSRLEIALDNRYGRMSGVTDKIRVDEKSKPKLYTWPVSDPDLQSCLKFTAF